MRFDSSKMFLIAQFSNRHENIDESLRSIKFLWDRRTIQKDINMRLRQRVCRRSSIDDILYTFILSPQNRKSFFFFNCKHIYFERVWTLSTIIHMMSFKLLYYNISMYYSEYKKTWCDLSRKNLIVIFLFDSYLNCKY